MKITDIISESSIGTSPKRPARAGSRPARGHEPQKRYGISKEKETQFHAKLDNLVHDTFGKREDEVEEGWFDSKPEAAKVDWNKRAKELFAKGLNEQQVLQQLIKEGCPPNQAPVYVQAGQLEEGADELEGKDLDYLQGYYSDFHKDLHGFRPRHHSEEEWNDPEFIKSMINKLHDYFDKLKSTPEGRKQLEADGWHISEDVISEKASRQLCKSSTPDEDLGASNLASCKSQGLRARDGEKSHLIGHGNSAVRIKVGGKRIKGKKYGGPLPDYGTRKGQ